MLPMSEIWKPDVTVAAIVESAGRYLLVEEKTVHGLQLNQPAGHLEAGESLIEAVVREAREETRRTFTPTGWLGAYLVQAPRPYAQQSTTYLRFAFIGTVGEPDLSLQFDEGIVRTVWLTLAEVRAEQARHRSPLVLRCIEDHAAGKPLLPLAALYAAPHTGLPGVVRQ